MLRQSAASIANWSIDNGMRINTMKTKEMSIVLSRSCISTGAAIEIVEQIKCIFGLNRANCDTSTKVGMGHLYGH